MPRLKLKHGYHDGIVRLVRYRDTDVVLEVNLCSCCNPSPGFALITFIGVQNFEEVRSAFESSRMKNERFGFVDEIVGVLRPDRDTYLLDLSTAGAVHVKARSLHEA